MLYNPSLSEQPRHRLAAVLPIRKDTSIIKWLEQTGRMLPREKEDDKYLEEEEVEIIEMLEVEYTLDDLEENDDMEID